MTHRHLTHRDLKRRKAFNSAIAKVFAGDQHKKMRRQLRLTRSAAAMRQVEGIDPNLVEQLIVEIWGEQARVKDRGRCHYNIGQLLTARRSGITLRVEELRWDVDQWVYLLGVWITEDVLDEAWRPAMCFPHLPMVENQSISMVDEASRLPR